WAARHWASRIGVNLRSVHLRAMARKWASISTAGRLTLDSSLLAMPRELGEFVIVHELVHLISPESGHGRLFKSFMTAYLPDWADREPQLRSWGQRTLYPGSFRQKQAGPTTTGGPK